VEKLFQAEIKIFTWRKLIERLAAESMTRNILSPAPEIYVVLYFQQLWRSSIKVQNFDCVYYSVEWAIASHGMYESTLVFKTEELVHSGLCAMWHLGHNSIFTFARIKILLWKWIKKCYTFGCWRYPKWELDSRIVYSRQTKE
jgi:hypothetical protein